MFSVLLATNLHLGYRLTTSLVQNANLLAKKKGHLTYTENWKAHTFFCNVTELDKTVLIGTLCVFRVSLKINDIP